MTTAQQRKNQPTDGFVESHGVLVGQVRINDKLILVLERHGILHVAMSDIARATDEEPSWFYNHVPHSLRVRLTSNEIRAVLAITGYTLKCMIAVPELLAFLAKRKPYVATALSAQLVGLDSDLRNGQQATPNLPGVVIRTPHEEVAVEPQFRVQAEVGPLDTTLLHEASGGLLGIFDRVASPRARRGIGEAISDLHRALEDVLTATST